MSNGAQAPAAKAIEPAKARPLTGLAARLFALVLVAILPALAIQAYTEVALRRSREAEVRFDALRLARFAAGELDRIIDNGRVLAVAIANTPTVRNQDAAACSTYLAALAKSLPQYLALGATDLSGQVVCASQPVPAGVSAGDLPYFKEAIVSGKFVVGDYFIGRIVHKPLLPLLLPFTGPNGRVRGVVYLSLDLDWLARYFQSDRQVNKDATLFIADRNGVILVRLPDNSRFVGAKSAKIYWPYIFASAPGTAEIIGVDGIRRILGYIPVQARPAQGLYIGVGLATTTALAAVNAASKVGFILIGLGLALGLLFAWLGGLYFISRPIERLVRASRHWTHGDFTARADLGRGGSEIVQLGRTFDDMAGELQHRQQENAALLESLETRVEQRTRALAAQARELADTNRELLSEMQRREQAEESLRHLQKIEALGQLTGGVAHDFNNLLQVILGNLDAAHRRVLRGGTITADNGWEQIQQAIRSAERAATLTRQLLAFARRQPLAPQSLDLNRLVSGMSEMLRRSLGETIAIETVLAGGLWLVSVDPSQLENAIINLAVNGRDAMPQGGRLTIETANAFLDEAYAGAHEEVIAGQYAMLAITDNGIGMPGEILNQVFDPFFTTKEAGRGTGLGLSQVYGFIKQSGGHVTIYSEPGQGTTVKMYLPRLAAAKAAAEIGAQPPPSAAGGKGQVILVVEDDPEVRDAMIGMLAELGYTVLSAGDGAAALQLVARHPEIQLLLTDVGLPGGLNGRQLAEQARAARSDLKVLYTTGYARNAIVHNGILDSGVELLVKPFTYAGLAGKVLTLLQSRN